MNDWNTIYSKKAQEHKKTVMRRKWPVVHYLKLITITEVAILFDFGLMEDIWVPKKIIYELDRGKQKFQTKRTYLEENGVDVKALEVLPPYKLKIRKNALLFIEWRDRNK